MKTQQLDLLGDPIPREEVRPQVRAEELRRASAGLLFGVAHAQDAPKVSYPTKRAAFEKIETMANITNRRYYAFISAKGLPKPQWHLIAIAAPGQGIDLTTLGSLLD